MHYFRNRHFFLIDLFLLPAVTVLAFALRLDAIGLGEQGRNILYFTLYAIPLKLAIFRLLGLYGRYWRYASTDEMRLILAAVGISSLVVAGVTFGIARPLFEMVGFPRSVPFIDGLLTLLAVGGPRFLLRLSEQYRREDARQRPRASCSRVLVVGAGDAGTMIVKEMRANPQLGLDPVAFVDDDKWKVGVQIQGVPVLGGREQIPDLVKSHRVDEAIIAIPTAPGRIIREVLETCRQAGIPARTVPGLYDILSGQVSVNQIRQVQIEDLLRRAPVETDIAAVKKLIEDCCVLVTGGGGSIGSELCRQICRLRPRRLVIVGHGETSIFRIVEELDQTCPDPHIEIRAVIADVRDRQRLDRIFGEFRPTLVFHAAAHKHVPLMEENLCEAITNNVMGTRNLIAAADAAGVDHFVLISTDKAVNPTSVMGVTKRIAELLVYQAARQNGRGFCVVRFGNVLGSRGSVVNVFRRQISRGGPVTVTHPNMTRFFMTIPEAVQLVLQAAALGKGAEVFVLDMGDPVKIVDLATDLIRLSGLTPRLPGDDPDGDWDIEVRYTGIRPGEKLYEELFVTGEGYGRTRHEKIYVAENSNGLELAARDIVAQIEALVAAGQNGDEAAVRALLPEIVREYRPGGTVLPEKALSDPEEQGVAPLQTAEAV